MKTLFICSRGSSVSARTRNEIKQILVTGAKVYGSRCKELVIVEKSQGKRSVPLKLPYILRILNVGGDDGKVGRTGEAHQRHRLTVETNDFVAALPVSGYGVGCCREPVRCGRGYFEWTEDEVGCDSRVERESGGRDDDRW